MLPWTFQLKPVISNSQCVNLQTYNLNQVQDEGAIKGVSLECQFYKSNFTAALQVLVWDLNTSGVSEKTLKKLHNKLHNGIQVVYTILGLLQFSSSDASLFQFNTQI